MLLVRPIGRFLLWAAVALVIVRGIEAMAGSEHEQATAPKQMSSLVDQQQAAAFAVRFATAFLSWQPGGTASYEATVDGFVASGLRDDAAAMLPRSGSGESVVSATVARWDGLGSQRAIITVACTLTSGQVRYLAVPVAQSSNGGLDVDALPSLVAPPAQGDASAISASPLEGSQADAVKDVADGFLSAYLSGEQGSALAQWLAHGVVMTAMPSGLVLRGLDGEGVISRGGSDRLTMQVLARVQEGKSGADYLLAYRLTLVKDDSGWHVSSIAGAQS